ncbi:hypothetical protein BB561_006241 [Smittium simulii]|uniref:Uncharacterized protein n=1 Tax=Smittium simulii TaxID=133385 RepID=A0A2T9Y5Q7_9FUNG|nr:hypothetical protein BB561_006241 [Smittium simulii]
MIYRINHLSVFIINLASICHSFEISSNNIATTFNKRDKVDSPYNDGEFSTECNLPNYVLAPRGNPGMCAQAPYISEDYITSPCNNKYFYMSFDANTLSSSGFSIMLNPTVFTQKYPAFHGQYSGYGNFAFGGVFPNQNPILTLGKPLESKKNCGNAGGKGFKYFLAYDKQGIHMGQNGRSYTFVPTSRIMPIFRSKNMLIQAASTLDQTVAVFNIKIKCLSGDTCSVSQSGGPKATAESVTCITSSAEKPNPGVKAPVAPVIQAPVAPVIQAPVAPVVQAPVAPAPQTVTVTSIVTVTEKADPGKPQTITISVTENKISTSTSTNDEDNPPILKSTNDEDNPPILQNTDG